MCCFSHSVFSLHGSSCGHGPLIPWTTIFSLLLIKKHLTCQNSTPWYILFILSPIDRQVGCSHFWDIPLLWTIPAKDLWMHMFSVFLDNYLWVELVDKMAIPMFNFMRCCQSTFHIDYTIFHPHQQCTRVSESSRSCQHLLFSIWFLESHSSGCKVGSHSVFYFHFPNE